MPREKPLSTDYYTNEMLGLKEEERHIRGSTTAINDTPSLKTIGEEHWEDKEEETNNSTTPPMPHHP